MKLLLKSSKIRCFFLVKSIETCLWRWQPSTESPERPATSPPIPTGSLGGWFEPYAEDRLIETKKNRDCCPLAIEHGNEHLQIYIYIHIYILYKYWHTCKNIYIYIYHNIYIYNIQYIYIYNDIIRDLGVTVPSWITVPVVDVGFLVCDSLETWHIQTWSFAAWIGKKHWFCPKLG